MTIYEQLVAAGQEVCGHESDLDVLVTPESQELVSAWGEQSVHNHRETFTDSTGRRWFRLLFQYDPFWAAKAEAARRVKREPSELRVGDRVRFTRRFLRATQQFSGPEYPCRCGPWAVGTILDIQSLDAGRPGIVGIDWGDGDEPGGALASNLERLA